MLQNLSEKVRRKTPANATPRLWAQAIKLAIAVGIAYFLAAQLSLALLAKSDGLATFWVAGGVSSGVLIVFGRNARWPVAAGAPSTTASKASPNRVLMNGPRFLPWYNNGEPAA